MKRRCLYHWVGFPSAERERQILQLRAPGAGPALAREVVAFVQHLRTMDLVKLPGIAETIDWARALMELDAVELDPVLLQDTLGVLLKYQDDIVRMQGGEAARVLGQLRQTHAHG